jgi:hypothetical protein
MLKMRELQMFDEDGSKSKDKKGSSSHAHMPPPLDGEAMPALFFKISCYVVYYRKSSWDIGNTNI